MTAPPLWRTAAGAIGLWVGLILSAVGLVFFAIGAQIAFEERAFDTQSALVDAMVVQHSIRRANFTDNPQTEYRVLYRFAGPDGALIERETVVPVEEWERLRPGERMKARVRSDLQSRTEGQSEWEAAIAFSCLGLIMCAVGAPILLLGVRDVARERHVWKHGVKVCAVVTAIAPCRTFVNGVQQWEIRYAYAAPDGTRHEARSRTMTEAAAKRWRKGDRAVALVDPQLPGSSVFAGSDSHELA